jgi:hypothetical protein
MCGCRPTPAQVMFVKFKEALVEQDSSTHKAAKYQAWMEQAQDRISGASSKQQASQQPVATHWDPSTPLVLPSTLLPAYQSWADVSGQQEVVEEEQWQPGKGPWAEAVAGSQGNGSGKASSASGLGGATNSSPDSQAQWQGHSQQRQRRSKQQLHVHSSGNTTAGLSAGTSTSGLQPTTAPSQEPMAQRISIHDNPEQEQLQSSVAKGRVRRAWADLDQQPPAATGPPLEGSQAEAVHQYLQGLRQQGLGRLQEHMEDSVLMYQQHKYIRQYQDQQRPERDGSSGSQIHPKAAGIGEAMVRVRNTGDINSGCNGAVSGHADSNRIQARCLRCICLLHIAKCYQHYDYTNTQKLHT